MPRPRRVIKLKLPEEFIERCTCDGVLPEVVLWAAPGEDGAGTQHIEEGAP